MKGPESSFLGGRNNNDKVILSENDLPSARQSVNPLECLGPDDLTQAWNFYVAEVLALREQLEHVLEYTVDHDPKLLILRSDANLFFITRADPERVVNVAWLEVAIAQKQKLVDGLNAYDIERGLD